MGYAVELYFDAVTETDIRSRWARLADAGVGDDLGVLGFRPHISLGLCGDLSDPAAFRAALDDELCSGLPLDVTLASVGLFPGTVLFLAPIVTTPLLRFHQQFARIFGAYAEQPAPLYAPGRWAPHCTLTLNLRPDEHSRAVEAALDAPLPLHGQLVGVGLSASRPDASRLRFLLS